MSFEWVEGQYPGSITKVKAVIQIPALDCDTSRYIMVQSKTGRGLFMFPGGEILPSENERQCLARKVLEETNLDVNRASLLQHLGYLELEMPGKPTKATSIYHLLFLENQELYAGRNLSIGLLTGRQMGRLQYKRNFEIQKFSPSTNYIIDVLRGRGFFRKHHESYANLIAEHAASGPRPAVHVNEREYAIA